MEIKLLEEDDWALFKEIRLEALKNHPENFGSSYEDELSWGEIKFRKTIEENYIFGVFIEGKMVSSTALSIGKSPRRMHIGEIWAVYTKSEYRGNKILSALLTHIINFAKKHVIQLKLSVNEDNIYAIRCYSNLGFKEYGVEPRALKLGSGFVSIILMVLKLD